MALGQFLQALTQFGQQPSLGQHFLAGQEQGRQLEDRELERERIRQLMETQLAQEQRAAEQYEFESSPEMRDLTRAKIMQSMMPKYDIRPTAEGYVHIPERPGAEPIPVPGVSAPKLPEPEAQRVKFETELYKSYVDKAQTNASNIKEAARAVGAIKEAIGEGSEISGTASNYRNMAANFLQSVGLDPKKTISLLNMNTALRANLDSALNKMGLGELATFVGETTDYEWDKAAEIVGTTATAQEALLALLQIRAEGQVNWLNKWKEAVTKYGDNYGKIANEMVMYEIENPLAAYEAESNRPIPQRPEEYLSFDELYNKSKTFLKGFGKGGKELYQSLYDGLLTKNPELMVGYQEIRDTQSGKILVLQDGVVVGVKDGK